MRVGLVGAGVISHNHLPHLPRLGAEVRVYSEAGVDELIAAHGGTVAASLDELLDWAQVADLASPTHTHYPLARQAIAAGLDVICESRWPAPMRPRNRRPRPPSGAVAPAREPFVPPRISRHFRSARAARKRGENPGFTVL